MRRITVMTASGCDGMAGTWMRSYRVQLAGFVLPYVNGDVQAASAGTGTAPGPGHQGERKDEPGMHHVA
jgi:hypothetical protein